MSEPMEELITQSHWHTPYLTREITETPATLRHYTHCILTKRTNTAAHSHNATQHTTHSITQTEEPPICYDPGSWEALQDSNNNQMQLK